MKDLLYQVTAGNACFGIIVRNGVVVKTAPYGRYLMGLSIDSPKMAGVRLSLIKETHEAPDDI